MTLLVDDGRRQAGGSSDYGDTTDESWGEDEPLFVRRGDCEKDGNDTVGGYNNPQRRQFCASPLTLVSVFVILVTLTCMILEVLGSDLVQRTFDATSARRTPTFDAVLSYYKEDYGSVRDLATYVRQIGQQKGMQTKVILYTKNPQHQEEVARLSLLNRTGVDEVSFLANVGRESETYLQHLVNNYKDGHRRLADWTLFSQVRR